MRILRSDALWIKPVNTLTVLFLIASIMFFQTGMTMGQESGQHVPDDKKITITSDLLITDNDSGFAEFSGNVRAMQGTTVISSDRLKVFYVDDADSEKKITGGAEAIEKIVAIGNVNINFEDKKALSNEAEYTIATRTLVLSGPDSKVITDNESISGSVITFYRDSGRIKVEGGKNVRVEAIFFDTGSVNDN